MNRLMRRQIDSKRRGLMKLFKGKDKSEQEYRNEYMQLAAQAGDLQYKILQLSNDLKRLNHQMENLNKEFSKKVASLASNKENSNVQTPASKP